MATSGFTYPYNPNGVLEECKVSGEIHTITPANDKNYNWFIPYAGPFFGGSVVLVHVPSGKTLQRGVDYNLGLEYHAFNTRVTLRPVYGAIILVDTTLTGQFRMDYMTIGGAYAINMNKALEIMANAAVDPRSTYWENVTDIPSQFPVTSHLHNVDDVTTVADIIKALADQTAAFIDSGGKWWQSLNEHLNDFADPHRVLEMLPGGGGESIPKATQVQAEAGTDNVAYATSLRVAQYCNKNVMPTITSHISARGNTHSLVPADINLGNVPNYRATTTADVDSSANLNNTLTTAAMVYYIISDAIAGFDVGHFTDYENPHRTTAAQVGLQNVPNWLPGTLTDAIAGTAETGFMNPYLTMQAISNYRLVSVTGICNTSADRIAYLAQNKFKYPMIDTITKEVYIYDVENLEWVLESDKTAVDYIDFAKFYFNPASMKGFYCLNGDLALDQITGPTAANVTVSTVPPTTTTGFLEGHIWFVVN